METDNENNLEQKGVIGKDNMIEISSKIWLVGLTGSGKSSTGNTILHGERFSLRSNKISVKSDLVFGEPVTVIDGSGIGDSAEDLQVDMKTLVENVEKVFNKTLNGEFAALVLVLKFCDRFLKQHRDCVKTIKAIFGDHVFKKCGVIVLTYGEIFDKEDNIGTFIEWCLRQGGDFRNLLIECEYRCVLFNNKAPYKKQKKTMVAQLMKCIDNVKSYGEEDFLQAEVGREKLKQEGDIGAWDQDGLKQEGLIRSSDNKDTHQIILIEGSTEQHHQPCLTLNERIVIFFFIILIKLLVFLIVFYTY
ncbi:uncharacterized protein LOC131938149 [Physella acuta]|uniref:uncharacterized protein LOC131938149 n=1 Tax=Physella acuta TaxID=109671 RepID=UPI0027DB4C6F|nr:uncharacterized protein LOC131938149 [Physella acuta]XP_059152049.1 uncharacterized protein LOC131938149 [Physella acuta]